MHAAYMHACMHALIIIYPVYPSCIVSRVTTSLKITRSPHSLTWFGVHGVPVEVRVEVNLFELCAVHTASTQRYPIAVSMFMFL